jgi:hypothetical protein
MNWFTAIKYGTPAAIMLALSIVAHNWRVDNLSAAWTVKREAAVKEAKDAVQKQCDENAAITKETSHALQTRLNALDAKLRGMLAKRDTHAQCLPVASAGRGSDGNAEAYRPFVGGGVSAEWLTIAGYDNDHQAATLIACQDTLRRIYTVNGKTSLLPQ